MRDNVGAFLAKRASLSPRLTGYIGPEQGVRLTFRELDDRCNRTANLLSDLGVRRGDRVALLMMNSVEFVESFFAVAKLGGIVVPLNWRLVPDELAFILGDSGAETLIYGEEFAQAAADLHDRGSAATSVRRWLSVGAASPAHFAQSYASLHEAASDASPVIEAGDGDDLYIMYTSGTTGLPKGAVHTHGSVAAACQTINATAEVRYGDVYLVGLPLFHVGALTPLTANVHRGITSIVCRAFDPVKVWELIEKEKVTSMLAVPAMLGFLQQAPNRDKVDRSTLRWIMSGAAPVPVSMIQTYIAQGMDIHQVYGLTETCGPSCLIIGEDAVAKAGSTGKAFFHTDVRVVDPDGNDVDPGSVGEVIVRGRHLMKEYWKRPEATAETIRGGWLYTGDLASIDEDGFVYIQDRKKDMIISGGENIYPAEVENVLLTHPKIRDAAVIGQPSEKWGESPAAVVVAEEVDAADVLEYTRGRLARYKQPRAVYFVDEIPRNPSGKILKRILRDRFPGPAPE
ncbi:MAG TPA: long-chain fatty acid--CoA ligase [Candidatus Limnocylindrales bacterium]|nr:long-chain fatty acid--CoA ligase [Candidatus Limnocylindrales bacterium]